MLQIVGQGSISNQFPYNFWPDRCRTEVRPHSTLESIDLVATRSTKIIQFSKKDHQIFQVLGHGSISNQFAYNFWPDRCRNEVPPHSTLESIDLVATRSTNTIHFLEK